jgi:tyrosine-protein phosphatase SIW14
MINLVSRSLRGTAFFLLCVGGMAGQDVPATAVEQRTIQPGQDHVPAKPCDDCVPGVGNFAKISEALWRGDQPTAEGFKNLEKQGLKTVVSFRHDHDDLALLKGTKLKYLRIPSFAFHPTEPHLVTFLKIIEDPANWPVYIHCAQGRDRTGYNAAAYRMVVQGWKADEAIREMNVFHFNKIWVGNPGFLKSLDPAKLQEKVKAEPKPALLDAPE